MSESVELKEQKSNKSCDWTLLVLLPTQVRLAVISCLEGEVVQYIKQIKEVQRGLWRVYLWSMALFNMFGSIFQASGTSYSPNETFAAGRAPRGKLSKSDIGTPSNFKHVTHVGFESKPCLDVCCDINVKALSGVEERLRDQELSCRIFEVIEKEGSMEALRRQTRRMTSVERPNIRTRLRSLSSSSLTPSKRQNCHVASTPNAATISDGSPSVYLTPLSKMSPPLPTPPSIAHLRSKKIPPHPLPQSCIGKTSLKASLPSLPMANLTSETSSYSRPTSLPTQNPVVCQVAPVPPPPLPQRIKKTSTEVAIPISPAFPSSVPNSEPLMKFGDVLVPPPLPPFSKLLHSGTIVPKPLSSESLPVTDSINGTVSPSLAFMKLSSSSNFGLRSSSETALVNGLEPPCFSDSKTITCSTASKRWAAVASNKDFDLQKNSTLFLEQIKQGMQLKSVSQTVKVETAECSNIVSALMDVIQRRNKAIHSSDEDNTDDDEWED
ncbi:actin nucleation-promoting factor WASL-like [Pseudophryne corroboree]|uniref:actin nucleation-promoting factor WASL-like n=1 Tax=Pseudophryne corroboree TaxID=495146 RepID=UPI003081D1BC